MFLRYHDIENWYREDKEELAKLDNSKVQVSEKLDGSNRMIYLDPEKPIEIYTRNGNITHDCDQFLPELEKIHRILMAPEKLALYAELYGSTINKRIDYHDKVNLKIFDANWIENNGTKGTKFSLAEIDALLEATHTSLQTVHWYILENFDINRIEDQLNLAYKSNESSSGMIEGWVISYLKKSENGDNDGFDSVIHTIKYKHKDFEDALRQAQVKVELTPEEKSALAYVSQMRSIFEAYTINDNRIIDMISKVGLPKDQINPAKFVAMVIQDAKADFLKDHPIDSNLEKKYVKMIFNLGDKLYKRCIELLK